MKDLTKEIEATENYLNEMIEEKEYRWCRYVNALSSDVAGKAKMYSNYISAEALVDVLRSELRILNILHTPTNKEE